MSLHHMTPLSWPVSIQHSVLMRWTQSSEKLLHSDAAVTPVKPPSDSQFTLLFMWFLCSHYDISHQPTRPERSRPPRDIFFVKLYPHRQPRVQTRWLRPLNGRRCLQRLLRINSLRSFLGTYEKYICIAVCVQFTEQIIFIGWRF